MNIEDALAKLYSMHQFGIKLGLDNINNLLDEIGSPHKNLKAFHVAGSNGKGSTASFIASILMEAGYKVGLYTSPHFAKFNERIRINSVMIDDDYISGFINQIDSYIRKNSPTFFEVTTALALKYFNDRKVDYAVIETGLGGRLDATNVLEPLASIITSISLEHTEHLGNTIEKIASEKAGIIKKNSPVLIGKMDIQAVDVIRMKASELGCSFSNISDFAKQENERVSVDLDTGTFSIYSTPLRGNHQLLNSSLAVKTVNKILGIENGIIISNGIKNVIKNTGIEGRYEVISQNPGIILDSAHNPEGVEVFIKEFSKEYTEYSERILIFGAMKDKSISGMLSLLSPYFTKIYLTQVQIDRAATIEELTAIAVQKGIQAEALINPTDFINNYLLKVQNNCLVVLGSMYLLGEIKLKKMQIVLDKLKEGD
jgi:dihydrofolate synthase / folylpolyglutamate synthase